MTKKKSKSMSASAISLLCLMADLAKKDGIKPYTLPGLWERKLNEHWTIKMNAHKEEISNLPPFTALVEFNGHPAGLVDPGGGTFASGKRANVPEFLKALNGALELSGGGLGHGFTH